jgi:DNA-binding NarL/FixJ family response regulator
MTDVPKKILVIEDDRECAALIAEELADRGFEVIVAHEGHEGLLSILTNKPALVLCDLGLPMMSGLEILRHINDFAPQIGHVPLVFLTALANRDDELQARRLGADDYVTKPVDFDILHVIINARLAGVARNDIWPKRFALSDRESETLTWLARGKTADEIGELLGMAPRTVHFHVQNACTKLGVKTRTEAAIKAALGGLIKP